MDEDITVTFTLSEIDGVTARLKEKLSYGDICVLTGELGAGKTTLVSSLVKVFGVREPVSSPTYVLQHIYSPSKDRSIEHWDLYRVSQFPEELLDAHKPNILYLVEWGERFREVLGAATWQLNLSYDGHNGGTRTLTAKKLR